MVACVIGSLGMPSCHVTVLLLYSGFRFIGYWFLRDAPMHSALTAKGEGLLHVVKGSCRMPPNAQLTALTKQ